MIDPLTVLLNIKPHYYELLNDELKIKYMSILGPKAIIYGLSPIFWTDELMIEAVKYSPLSIKTIVFHGLGSTTLYDISVEYWPESAHYIPDDFYKILGLLKSPDTYRLHGAWREYNLMAIMKGVDYEKIIKDDSINNYCEDPDFLNVCPKLASGMELSYEFLESQCILGKCELLSYVKNPPKDLILKYCPNLYYLVKCSDEELISIAKMNPSYELFENKVNYYTAMMKCEPSNHVFIDGSPESVMLLKTYIMKDPYIAMKFQCITTKYGIYDDIMSFALIQNDKIAPCIKITNRLAELLLDLDLSNVKYLNHEYDSLIKSTFKL